MCDVGCGMSDVLRVRGRGARSGNPHVNHPASELRHRPRGFTLLETALAMVIVLVGVLAMIEAQGSFILSNGWSSHEATATYLAGEIRERMRTLPRHDPVTGLSLVMVNGVPTLQGLGREPAEITVND